MTGDGHDIRRSRLRSFRIDSAEAINTHIFEFIRRNNLLINRSDFLADLKRAVAPHELKRRQAFTACTLLQSRHGILKDVFVIFINAQTLALMLLRFDELANAKIAHRINAPRQLKPELILFPDLARINEPRVAHLHAHPLTRRAQDGLAKTYPLRVVRLVRMKVVTLRAVTHR